MAKKNIILALTGASGAGYGLAALNIFARLPDYQIHLIISNPGKKMLKQECNWQPSTLPENCHLYDNNKLDTPLASGSFACEGMIISPSSLHTAMSIGAGLADNLILRAGQVCLKEKRKLVLVLRETPLAAVHLEKLAQLSRDGVIVMPASPGFYNNPADIQDIFKQVSARAISFLIPDKELVDTYTPPGS
ncbi:MAG: UbiX family flavin prenyltransferase [Myxococcota bacterium]